MNKKSLIIGVTITCIWFLGIYLFCFLNGYKLPESLNELGDFLAGIFAPVAFFWLILGYMQQGKQLDQNTKALEQQERALQLQIEEMKESVKQQAELAEIQKKQFGAMNESVKPILVIKDSQYTYFSSDEGSDFLVNVKFRLTNFGGVANVFCIRNSRQKAIYSLEQINERETVLVEVDFYELDLDINDKQQTMLAEITFDFENLYAYQIVLDYEVYIQTEMEAFDREGKCLVYRRD
ncbi:MAG: hypothetical protein RR285_14630 [Acinetobacter sp.]